MTCCPMTQVVAPPMRCMLEMLTSFAVQTPTVGPGSAPENHKTKSPLPAVRKKCRPHTHWICIDRHSTLARRRTMGFAARVLLRFSPKLTAFGVDGVVELQSASFRTLQSQGKDEHKSSPCTSFGQEHWRRTPTGWRASSRDPLQQEKVGWDV